MDQPTCYMPDQPAEVLVSTSVPAESLDHPLLVIARDREATAAILGYVYQVDLTIEGWIQLGPSQILDLERGEDVDHISRGLAGAPPDEWGRVLEQIKHRVGSLTLRTPALRAAFANFLEHRRANPEAALATRFTTNARVGREQNNTLPRRGAGVAAWERLRTEAISREETVTLLVGIRSFLSPALRPHDVPPHSWTAWQNFVRDAADEELLGFIQRFEIATGAPDARSLRPRIVRKLHERGLVATEEDAERVYPVLFVSVFKLLCERGPKQLTQSSLRAELQGVGPGAMDRVLREKLELLHDLEHRLTSLAGEVGEVRGDLGRLDARVQGVESTIAVLQDAQRPQRLPVREGDTEAFQTTNNYFGRELSPETTFNHARNFVGRDDLLADAIGRVRAALDSGAGGLIIVGGPGGAGKSRFLLELARVFAAEGEIPVRWVRDREAPSITSLQDVPAGPLILICDDVHRRADLEDVVSTAEARNDPTVLIAGSRPRGREALMVAAFQAGVGAERIWDLGNLEELDEETLLTLLRGELGPDFDHYAEDVVRTTRGSALIALVAAHLLRTRQLNPGVLAQDQEVRRIVLASFEAEAYGRLGEDVNPELARRVLELFSAIGPVDIETPALLERVAAFVRSDPPEVIRVIGYFEDAGVLRSQRRGMRISPDVLSDYILHRFLVTGQRLTGAEVGVLEALGTDVLPNLVRNVAELDWQIAAAPAAGAVGAPRPVDVLGGLWNRFVRAFQDAPNYQRGELLEQLRPVASFQPRRVLDLCEWLLQNPEGDDRPAHPEWRQTAYQSTRVVSKVPDVIAVSARHEEHLERALDLLWRMRRQNSDTADPHSEHAPIRAITGIVGYSRYSGVGVQERALTALRRWTHEPGWSIGPDSPLVITKEILRTAVVVDEYHPRKNSISMTRYAIDPEITRGVREEAISLLAELAVGDEPKGRVWAVDALTGALRPPESQLGHDVTDEEEESFRGQYEVALAALRRVLEQSEDPLVLIRARDALLWVPRQTRLPWKREAAERLLEEFPETEEMIFTRAWGRSFHAFGAQRRFAGDEVTRRAAELLMARDADTTYVLERVRQEEARFEAAGLSRVPGPVLTAMAQADPELGVAIAAWLTRTDEGPGAATLVSNLSRVLAVIQATRPEDHAKILEEAARSERAGVRAAAAHALGYAVVARRWHEHEQGQIRALLADPDPEVRVAAVGALDQLPAGEIAGYLGATVIGGSRIVLGAIAELWVYRSDGERPDLSPEQVEPILAALKEIPSLDSSSGDLESLLAALAASHPLQVVDSLLARARREQVRQSLPWEERGPEYDAVPYGGLQEVWGALQATADYPAIVQRLLAGIAEEARAAEDPVGWPALDLARSMINWDPEVERVVRAWMAAGQCGDVAALAPFFEQQVPGFVFTHRQFVDDLLAWTEGCAGPERERLISALAHSPFHRPYVRTVGAPSPHYVQFEVDARQLAHEYRAAGHHSAARFYEGIAREAEQRIAEEVARDRRSEDPRAAEDWDDD
jgi:hypothetical protein